jgi:ferric enterobactin receptor
VQSILRNIILTGCIAFGFFSVSAQQPDITIFAGNQTLDAVLQEITEKYDVRFAYDSDAFQKIETGFSLNEVPLDQFLQQLRKDYFIRSEKIDGTWVLIPGEPIGEETSPSSKPQEVPVSGYVTDQATGEQLIYCNVATGTGRGGMTNELGFFKFQVPLSDSVLVSISHLGYKRLDTIIPTATKAMIRLEPADILIEPVQVVHFEKQVLQASPHTGRIAFNPLKASHVPRISNDDLGNALLLIPGVHFFQGGPSGLSIRGSAPTDNLILFDGIPVLETSHLLGNMSVLNAKFVQQAFVSRGGFDAGFGERVSGLIQLTGKSGKTNKPTFDLSANLMNSNVLTNVPVGDKFSVTAAWRRSFIDQWQNYLYYRLIDDVVANEDNPVTSTIVPNVKYQDVNGKVSFHPSENLEFNLNVLYGNDDQSRDFELIRTKDYYRNERVKSESLGMSLNWKWQVTNNWFHSFSAGFSTLEKEVVDETGELQEITEVIENPGQGVGRGKGLAKTKERTFTRLTYDIDNGFNHIEEYRASWKTEFNTGIFRNEAGAGWTHDRYSYDFFANRTVEDVQIDSIASDATQNLLHAFMQQHIDLDGLFHFRWGIRANVALNSRDAYWQPRGGIEFIPVKGLKFYYLSGVYYQFLSGIKRFDREGHMSRIWYLPGQDGRGVVQGTHHVPGMKFEKNGWFVNAEGYLKKADGKVNLFAGDPVNSNAPVVSYFPRESKERSSGLDVFVQKKHFNFNHMIGYSYSKTEEQITGVLSGRWFPGLNDRTHRLKITEMVRWRKWSFTGSWQMASGLPVVRFSEIVGEQDFERSESFSQLDFSIVKKFNASHFSFQAGTSLLNVLNRPNVIEVNYLRFVSDLGAMTVRSDISALSFTPVFFMNVKF